MRKDVQNLWNLVEPYVTDAGFDLVEVQSGREPTGWIVRLFIDRPAGSVDAAVDGLLGAGVSHKDCERVSRDVSAALDVADMIPNAYELEVSSPGLDRPLRRQQDFVRFAGQQAKIRLSQGYSEHGQGDGGVGRRNFSGRLLGAHDGLVEIECDGRTYHLPIEDVAKANLVPDWGKELKRSAS